MRRISKRCQDLFSREAISLFHFFIAITPGKGSDYCGNVYTRANQAWLAKSYGWIHRDAGKYLHVELPTSLHYVTKQGQNKSSLD
jgi:hypothetical protein